MFDKLPSITSFISRDRNIGRLLGVALFILIILSILNPGLFLTVSNFKSMAYQLPEFGLLAMAIMIALLTGGIDLSAVGIANLSGVLAALIMIRFIPQGAAGWQITLVIGAAVALGLVIGAICGAINGFLIGRIGIPAILATLGTMQLFTGISIIITKGYAVLGLPDAFLYFGNGTIGIFPVPLLIFIVIAVLFALLLNKTALGQELFLMGTNPTAAKFTGLDNFRLTLKTYMVSGLLSGLAGLMIIARTNSAKADYGASYTLQAIVVAVMGGVDPAGGAGTVIGLVLAMISLQFLSSGFNMLRVGGSFSNYFRELVWGVVLILVMVINYLDAKKRARTPQESGTDAKAQMPDTAAGAGSAQK